MDRKMNGKMCGWKRRCTCAELEKWNDGSVNKVGRIKDARRWQKLILGRMYGRIDACKEDGGTDGRRQTNDRTEKDGNGQDETEYTMGLSDDLGDFEMKTPT